MCKAPLPTYWDRYGKQINAKRRKAKVTKYCKYCDKPFETSRDNQLFCSPKHKEKQHYKDRSFNELTRAKAIQKIHDKNKKRVGGFEYTPAEVKQIIKMFNKNKNAIEISLKLDRPVQGVRWKLRQLKQNNIIFEKGNL